MQFQQDKLGRIITWPLTDQAIRFDYTASHF